MNRKTNAKDVGKRAMALLVIFLVIVVRDASLGTLNLTWTALIGGIVIALSLSTILFHNNKEDQAVDHK